MKNNSNVQDGDLFIYLVRFSLLNDFLRPYVDGEIFFFFNDTATTEIYTNLNTLSLLDALPIPTLRVMTGAVIGRHAAPISRICPPLRLRSEEHTSELQSHSEISYAVFCLK